MPNDNDDEVGARGILYLLIFQQLGQLLRWSWGYNVLLAPADKYSEEEGGTGTSGRLEQGQAFYSDDPENDPNRPLLSPIYDGEYDSENPDDERTRVGDSPLGLRTPPPQRASAGSSRSLSPNPKSTTRPSVEILSTPLNGNAMPHLNGFLSSLTNMESYKDDQYYSGPKGFVRLAVSKAWTAKLRVQENLSSIARAAFATLPGPVRTVLAKSYNGISRFSCGLWEFMNPPLWAMLIAIIVASVPKLQHLFFDPGTFLRNSVIRAVEQSGGVAVPLILVVLGGNLARNTLPKASIEDMTDAKEERKLLVASLISRMVLPTVLMAPLLALTAKYVPVSIVDDKIFIIVCFLLTGAPTALQLAQICQVNNVYMGVMSRILFQSYVVWILPSTLILVMLALETVEWAAY